LEAYQKRDYLTAADIAADLLAANVLDASETIKAEQLRRTALEMQESIELDLSKVEGFIEAGKYYEASLDLPQLEGVVVADHPRLVSIQKKLHAPSLRSKVAEDKKRYDAYMESIAFEVLDPEDPPDTGNWICLTPQSEAANRFDDNFGMVPADQAQTWRMMVCESIQQAPSNWEEPGFDDSSWLETALPMSWHLNHTVLLRAKFTVKDKQALDALRVRLWTFRQQNIQIYLNGVLVAKVNNASKNARTSGMLPASVLTHLKNGENTLAVTSLNNWRWGIYMNTFESETSNSVYNNGFTTLLDARMKSDI
jgi:hypothetical protein